MKYARDWPATWIIATCLHVVPFLGAAMGAFASGSPGWAPAGRAGACPPAIEQIWLGCDKHPPWPRRRGQGRQRLHVLELRTRTFVSSAVLQGART